MLQAEICHLYNKMKTLYFVLLCMSVATADGRDVLKMSKEGILELGDITWYDYRKGAFVNSKRLEKLPDWNPLSGRRCPIEPHQAVKVANDVAKRIIGPAIDVSPPTIELSQVYYIDQKGELVRFYIYLVTFSKSPKSSAIGGLYHAGHHPPFSVYVLLDGRTADLRE